jgi:hypothetical protein
VQGSQGNIGATGLTGATGATGATGPSNPTAVTTSNVNLTLTSTNAAFYPTFVEATTGNLGIRTDSGITYNPSTDALSAGAFIPSQTTVPTTGMFLPAANTLGLSTTNIERIRIGNSGNVGIGTATPLGNLHVMGNIWVSNNAAFIGGIRFPDGTFQTTASSGSNVTIVDDTTTAAARYINFTSATSGTAGNINVSSTKLVYYPLTGNVAVGGNLTVSNAAGISTFAGNVGIGTTTATAGYILSVNGGIAATTKSFVIPHPTKDGKKLQYASLEGPENGVYLRGKLAGHGKIMLPEYWSSLVDMDTVTVTLTPFGQYQKLYVGEITDEHIAIGVDGWFGTSVINCYYTVYAERRDVPRLMVEV